MRTALLLIFFLVFFSVKAQYTPVSYLAAIDEQIKKVQQHSWQYVKSISKGKVQRTEKKRQLLLAGLGEAISGVASIPPYKNSADLRDSALAFLMLNQALVNEDYARIVDIAPIAEHAYDAMEAYIMARQKAEARLLVAANNLQEQYRIFASEHNIEVAPHEGKVAANLSKAEAAYSYYNKVYQIFFENYKQESYLLEAIQQSDISAIQQNLNALQQSSERGLNALREMDDYKKDDRLIKACIRLLTFYKYEAEMSLAGAANFFVDRDNMIKLQQAYQSKKDGEATTEEHKAYKAAVKNYRKELNDFERTSRWLHGRRKNMLESWNNAGSHFISRHVK